MDALNPETVRLIYEAIASLVVALLVALFLFRFFFDGWRDYLMCCYPSRRSFLSWLSSDQPDGNDRARGYVYNGLWLAAAAGAFYLIHRYFG
jgi:hypothetical protein